MNRSAITDTIIPNSTKFPNGISDVADQVHNLGLKFGIYRCIFRIFSLPLPHTLLLVMRARKLALDIQAHWATRKLMSPLLLTGESIVGHFI